MARTVKYIGVAYASILAYTFRVSLFTMQETESCLGTS
jgi:hypothetical protein